MFIELMPLIGRRALTITVSAIKEGRIRANVVPTALKEDSKTNDNISKRTEWTVLTTCLGHPTCPRRNHVDI